MALTDLAADFSISDFSFSIEELSVNAWPALKTLLYDGWIIRLSNGYSNRANSINPIYPSTKKLDEKIKYCEDFFSRYNLPAVYKIVGFEGFKPCEEHKAIDKKLEELDYEITPETSIQTREIMEFRDSVHAAGREGMIVTGDFDEHWIEVIIKNNSIEEKHIPTFRKILENIAVEKIVVRKEIGGKTAACAFGAIENDYVGIFDVGVMEEFRGKGFGREIVETILAEAAKRGVKNSYLQVMLINHVALSLYKKLGYKEKYRYWYRKKVEKRKA